MGEDNLRFSRLTQARCFTGLDLSSYWNRSPSWMVGRLLGEDGVENIKQIETNKQTNKQIRQNTSEESSESTVGQQAD